MLSLPLAFFMLPWTILPITSFKNIYLASLLLLKNLVLYSHPSTQACLPENILLHFIQKMEMVSIVAAFGYCNYSVFTVYKVLWCQLSYTSKQPGDVGMVTIAFTNKEIEAQRT